MTVITYGTFDMFHVGHLRLLERAKALAGEGGKLIVAVSTDRFNWEEKQKKCAIPDVDRMAIVKALKCVDEVIPEDNWEQKKTDVEKYGVDIFVMGDDWKGKFDFLEAQCKVVYLPRTQGVSSTDLKAALNMNSTELGYGNYRKSLALRIKDGVRKVLKSSWLGQKIYPFFQKCWRAYAIPKRQKRLQKHGVSAMRRLHSLMIEKKIPYYCDYGTLIGFVRDNGFIKHDDDIDISIQPNTVKPVDVLKIFMDAGYGFVHGFNYEGRLIEFTVADVSGVTIDVFFPTELSEGKINGYQPIWDPTRQYPSEKANTVIQYDFVEAVGVKTINVLGVAVLVPGNYDEVLTSEYGPWKVPDAKFNTVTDRVHRELSGYAYRLTKEEALAM
jgi:glycerol-3-phosphate cytidylyltransferase